MAIKTYSKSKDGHKKLSEHFSVCEFASPDSDEVIVDTALVAILERLHGYLECSKIIITSGYRTPEYDKKVGGNGKGYHTLGRAADVNCWHKKNGKEERYHGSDICCALQELGWNHGVGWIAGAAVHVDTRGNRYWFDEQNGNRSIGDDWYSYMASKGFVVDKPIKGDVNFDGKVDSTDARLTLQSSVGKIEFTEKQNVAADVDCNGKVDSTDAREILQKAVGK